METKKGQTAVIAAVLLLTATIGIVAIASQIDFIGSSVTGQGDCSFEPFTPNNQTLSTMQEAKTTYQQLGGQNWTKFRDEKLQVRDGVVQIRLCEYS